MKRFNVIFEYVDQKWVANCNELRITLEEGSFDALVVRMKVAIQEIAKLELGINSDFKLLISMSDRVDEIKAVG
jgi:hypothetical protein